MTSIEISFDGMIVNLQKLREGKVRFVIDNRHFTLDNVTAATLGMALVGLAQEEEK